ncbi:putative ribosomal N-acetyltransferase YdaF [Oxobacter pfennigii]|uniref:Putative ribosomal N-acetyltransferase YdaF n=1 Tax=Oxobacter pfennigii TaxID=36849 RepID=A0A0P8YVP1_9CLOT|nr:GNAT family protein [Oxobacter pfennigii]KPU43767.1 putative ribosomal N-acetyltransferase YdaF [Oxobacter pfennigii]
MRNLLAGKRVKLTAIKEFELDIVEGWFNNVEFLRYYDYLPALPMSRNTVKELIEGFENNDKYLFAVRSNDDGKIVGIAGFDDIIWSSGVATIFIGIGDDNYKGKGIGREAIRLMLDFGFNEFNFYRIQLNVLAYNEPAIRLYEGAGFIMEGALRDFVLRDGKRHDLYMYGLLKPEWINRNNNTNKNL